jgi:hypothetical protein
VGGGGVGFEGDTETLDEADIDVVGATAVPVGGATGAPRTHVTERKAANMMRVNFMMKDVRGFCSGVRVY